MMTRDDRHARDGLENPRHELENHVDGVLPEDARVALRLGGAAGLNAALDAGRARWLDRLARDAVAAVAAARAALANGQGADQKAALDRARARLCGVRAAALGYPRTPISTPR
ncbi:hypothetical protein SAMN05216241_11924 [Limimonas halophila]|uniref:Uncharacterized protein n=1 Tax=Limimonas halophila TaxID=1082479 RepID=A0A1G7V3Q8_9PROT|nr:hypothetical protein [Limimonas halophila]SDG53590.1 hypothetical protein SAMN05216241_11924 [Limimonas halophila]